MTAALETSLPGDVPSLMLPFMDKVLLVPTVTIAEIIGYRQPQSIDGAPDWLLGLFAWRDQMVPLLSLEALCGEAPPPAQRLSRVAVFNYTGVDESLPFVAVPTVGIPKLARVTAEDLTWQEEGPRNGFEKARVSLHGDDLVIPDVAALEQAYLGWRRSQPG